MSEQITTKRGRKPATGPFATRQEFCDAIWDDYRRAGSTVGSIAKWLGVSPPVVNKVIDTHEGIPPGWKPDSRS